MNNASNLLLKHCVEKISKATNADMSFGYLVDQENTPSFIDQKSNAVVTDLNLLGSTQDLINQKITNTFLEQECIRESFYFDEINIASNLPLCAHKKITNICYLPIIENECLYAIVVLVNIIINKDSNVLVDVKPFLSTALNLLKGSKARPKNSVSPVELYDEKLIETILNNTFHPALLFDDELVIVKANSASQRLFNANTQRGWVALDKLLEKAIPETALQVFSTISKLNFLGHLDCTHWNNVTFMLSEYQSIKVDIHLFEYKQENKQFFGLMLNEKFQENGINNDEYYSSIQRFKTLTNVIPTAIIQVDNNWQCSYVNETWTRYTNLNLQQSIGRKWLSCLSDNDQKNLLPKVLRSTSKHKQFKKEIQLQGGANQNIWVELHIAGLFSDRYELTGMILTMQDITRTKQNAEKLTKLANYDHLTGLSNRTFFTDRLTVAISRVRRHGLMAVMFIDLDKFKHINDTMGHPVGDKVIQEVGRRLKVAVRDEDSIARLGGDEFAIILTDVIEHKFLAPIADKVITAMHAPFELDGKNILLSCSVGIATSDDEVLTPSDILRKSDLALYQAKKLGRNQYCFYNKELESESSMLSNLKDSLSNISNQHFSLVFQPQIDARTEDLVGFEALSRWTHPNVGSVGPDVFINIIENNGLMDDFSIWLFEDVIQISKSWHQKGIVNNKQKIAINLSANQLHRTDLAETIIRMFSDKEATPSWFTLEVTETALIQDPSIAGLNLQKLKDAGFTIALDDFGTGYSSLSILKQMPINTIKIDRSFIKDILIDQDNASIVLAIIGLGKMLKIDIIVEGVEDKATMEWLLETDCYIHQGYYFYKPLTETNALALLQNHQRKN
ncbi:EAL domain-containing protein [Pseudocolwellia sp. HL-MZ7]|uniref:EAL domain-containing protein n=1 Tax=Pseudocolwellia sp. HL-MZ7 TaxID=3400627 RepID=UPI003CE8A92C